MSDGIDRISNEQRRGAPAELFWTWSAPNWKFATLLVGVLSVAVFGGGFWPTVVALFLGSAFGALAVGVLSTWGPKLGIAQLVHSRAAFGYHGNRLPAFLNTLSAGLGWFAVNTLSATFALVTLTGLPLPLTLPLVIALQVGLACCGHAAISRFTRLVSPALAALFVLIVGAILSQARPTAEFNPAAPAAAGGALGAFLLTWSIAFGYAVSWAPCAMDFARFLPARSTSSAVARYALLGVLVPCVVLELGGAGLATIAGTAWGPTDSPTDQLARVLPPVLANLSLLGIALGAVSANVLNCYSGALSFLSLGVRFGSHHRQRVIVAILLGAAGYALAATGAADAGRAYQNFLLLLGYWIAPFVGVVVADAILWRDRWDERLFDDREHQPWSGVVAMVLGVVVSVPFWNQALWHGPVVDAMPQLGDVSVVIGFATSAAVYRASGQWRRTARANSPAAASTFLPGVGLGSRSAP